MALLVWLPLNKEGLFLNQGLADITVTNNGATYDANGKIGGCLHTITSPIDTGLNLDNWNYTQNSVSMCCWLKMNKQEIAQVVQDYPSYTSQNVASGTVIGRINYNGFGICWVTSNLYNPTTALNTISIFGAMRNTYGVTNTSYYTIPYDIWVHVALTFNIKENKYILYINGELFGSIVSGPSINGNWTYRGNFMINNNSSLGGNGPFLSIPMYLNDVRIYDHCLSPKEVHEIAKGLVLHYPMNDEYVESTTNIIGSDTCGSLLNGTWGGHAYTSVKYTITSSDPVPFQDCQKCTVTYSGSGGGGVQSSLIGVSVKGNTTYCYSRYIKASDNLVYTHKNFLYRYEYTNSTPVTEAGVFSNSRKEYIGNGWYRCWGVFTTSSETNHLSLYFYTYPNKNVEYLLGGILLEEKDHMTPYTPIIRNETTVYDCSGYCNNGTITGSLQVVDDSPRYNKSVKIINSTISHPLCLSNDNLEWTCCAWIKPTSLSGYLFLNNFNKGNIIYYNGGYPLLYLNAYANDYYNYGNLKPNINEWTHIAFVFKNSTGYKHIFINGEDVTDITGPNMTSTPFGLPSTITLFSGFNGQVSDYREYSTALSEDDIKELYNTSAIINNNNTLETYEFSEANTYSINKSGVLEGAEFIEQDGEVLINNTEQVFATEFTEI